MLVIHLQVAPIQRHISIQQHHNQDRKPLLCQVLWSAEIKRNPTNYVTYPMLRGNPSGTLSCLLQPSCFSSLRKKLFLSKQRELHEWKNSAFILVLLTASPWPALPFPREPMAQTVLLLACMESHVAQENRQNADGISVWQDITVAQTEMWLHYLSVLLQEYGCLCMPSLFN